MALKKDPLTGRLYHQAISDPQRTRWTTATTGGGPPAPSTASYITATAEASLPNERVLTAGTAILIADNGPNSTIVVSVDASAIPHGSLSGLTTGDAGHTQFFLLAGRSGGQTGFGGTSAGEELVLNANSSGSAAGGIHLMNNVTAASSSTHRFVEIGGNAFTKSGGELTYLAIRTTDVLTATTFPIVFRIFRDSGVVTGGTSLAHVYKGLELGRSFSGSQALDTYIGLFDTANIGTTATAYYSVYASPVGSGTLTSRYGLKYLSPAGLTQGESVALSVDDQTVTTLAAAVESSMTAGTGKYHLYLTGDAPSLFGGEVRFQEPSGTNYSAFVAQAQAGDITYTLPAADAAGVLTSDGVGNLSWATGGGGSGMLIAEVPSGTVDGVNDTFTLSQTPVTLLLYKNGLFQKAGTGNDYTLSGSTITFEAGNIPQTGDILFAIFTTSVFTEEVPSGTVDGSNDTFTLTTAPIVLLLYKNGMYQRAGGSNDYTLASNTITFVAGNIPQTGDILYAVYTT